MSTEAAVVRDRSKPWTASAVTSTARWMMTAAWAVVDQALFGLANFIVNVMMARWLSSESYGAFTLAYSLFLLLSTVHTGLLAEPMIVFGAGKYRDTLPAYVAVLMRGHWVLTGLASLTLAVAGIILGQAGEHALSIALLGLAAANPLMLWLWFMRRGCYVRVEPRLAASGNLCYMALLVTGAYVLARLGDLSAASAFALMGGASLASALYIRSRLRLTCLSEVTRAFRHRVVADHRAYGRWAVGTGVLGGLTLYVYYLVLPATHGLESTASLRALTNLVLPAVHTFWVLSVLNVPRLVRARETPAFGTLVRQLLILNVSAALLYWIILGVSHEYLVNALYGGRYTRESHLLWALGLMPVAIAAATTLETALRSGERADAIFRANLLAAVCTCLIGLPLMAVWGIGGAIAGILSSYACAVCSLVSSVRAQPQRTADTGGTDEVRSDEPIVLTETSSPCS